MLKNILELNGVQKLNRNQQKVVNGGGLIGVHPDDSCGQCGVCKPFEECVAIFCGPNGPFGSTTQGTACKVVIGHK
ncbi:hypothetical protein [Aquimarina sp. 2201CG14-23]|uniref:hypothetical protein n=1 Tax=Aquimarina mycalae TaxID=3040073 RepID=UPI0024781BB0|nr:hypothetical protein [Aquimarina sp. 2201CG14-23]MDH7446962.1 hypothetical protein [Aquimarina sp. 2201CG14-23]